MKNILKLSVISGLTLVIILASIYAYFSISNGTEFSSFYVEKDGELVLYEFGTIFPAEDNDVTQYGFYGYFDRLGEEDMAVMIQLPDVMAFDVYVNDIKLYSLGDVDNPLTVARNHVYVILIDQNILYDSINEFRLVTSEREGTVLIFPPTLHEYQDAVSIAYTKNFILNKFFLVLIVITLLSNVLLFFLSRNLFERKYIFNIIIVISTLIIISTLQYYYFPITYRFVSFFMIKKISNIAMCLAIVLFYHLIDWYKGEFKKFHIFDIPFALSALSILFVQNYSTFPIVVTVHIVILLLSLLHLLFLIIKNKLVVFTPFIVIVIIGTLEMVFCFMGLIPNLYLIYISIFFIVFNMYILAYETYNSVQAEAMKDKLTGAYNRRYLDRYSFKSSTKICFVDLDKFKQYNDAFGHSKGDELLEDLVCSLGQIDFVDGNVVRYGGDEFLLLINTSDLEPFTRELEQLQKSLMKTYNGVSFSYGIGDYTGDLNQSIKNADVNMYIHKVSKNHK